MSRWNVRSDFSALILAMLSLLSNEVHIWHQSLLVLPPHIRMLSSFLSQDEQQRASRFRHELSRQQYIVGRGSLRCILSQYSNFKPKQVQFGYSQLGKPFLITDSMPSGIQFNLSHSDQKMLVAVSAGSRVGIDLEYVHKTLEITTLSKRYFSTHEQHLLLASPQNQKINLFLQLWTCKEALLKASGSGLRGLEHIEVLALPKSPFDRVWFAHQPLYKNFTLRVIPISSDYVAALAIEGHGIDSIKMHSLQSEQ